MNIIDGKHPVEVEQTENKVPFKNIRPGELFIHGNRVLIRVESELYRIGFNNNKASLDEFNSIRLGCIGDTFLDTKDSVAGKPSTIGPETMVVLLPVNATLYLKG